MSNPFRVANSAQLRANLAPAVNQPLTAIFEEMYRELRPREPIPPLAVQLFPFASVKNTIRLRDGKLLVRLSDVLEGAPENVLRAIAHILLAKMYRKPVAREHSTRYRRHVSSQYISSKAHLFRQIRGRKRVSSPAGRHFDLEEIFEKLNREFFFGLLGRPRLGWSATAARNRLGHYDPAHNAIIISKIFDNPRVPPAAVEYIVYHEMLHLKHPVKIRGSRRCVHSWEFQAEERQFPKLQEAKAFLRHL